MRTLLLILFFLPTVSFGQSRINFGGNKGTDTAWTNNYLELSKLSDSDSSHILSSDKRGKLYLKPISGLPIPTLQQVTNVGATTGQPVQLRNRTQIGDSSGYVGRTAHFFGNSITRGQMLPVDSTNYRFSTQISNRLGFIEDNQGISGSTLSLHCCNSMYDSISTIPYYSAGDVLIISYGVNDARYAYTDFDTATFVTQYKQILDTAIIGRNWPRGSILLNSLTWFYQPGWVTPPPVDKQVYFESFSDAVERVANSKGVKFVNLFDTMRTYGKALLYSDTLHVNSAGHSLIANLDIRALNEMGFGKYVIDSNILDVYGKSYFRGVLVSDVTTGSGSAIIIGSNDSLTWKKPTEPQSTVIGGYILNQGNSGYSVIIGGADYGKGNSYFNTIVGVAAQTDTSEPNNTAIGAFARCIKSNGTALGSHTKANFNSLAAGGYSEATGRSSVALGAYSKAQGTMSYAINAVNTEDSTIKYGDRIGGVAYVKKHEFNGPMYLKDVPYLGAADTVLYRDGNGKVWRVKVSGGGGSVAWGAITGTLSDQLDLQAALNARELLANKSTDATFLGANNTTYPTTLAVRTLVSNQVAPKIDTVYRRIGTDSVFIKKGGVESYAFRDSIGTGSSTPGGANTQIQFNNSSSFGGDSRLTYNNSTKTISFDTASINKLNKFDTTSTESPYLEVTPYGYSRNYGVNGIQGKLYEGSFAADINGGRRDVVFYRDYNLVAGQTKEFAKEAAVFDHLETHFNIPGTALCEKLTGIVDTLNKDYRLLGLYMDKNNGANSYVQSNAKTWTWFSGQGANAAYHEVSADTTNGGWALVSSSPWATSGFKLHNPSNSATTYFDAIPANQDLNFRDWLTLNLGSKVTVDYNPGNYTLNVNGLSYFQNDMKIEKNVSGATVFSLWNNNSGSNASVQFELQTNAGAVYQGLRSTTYSGYKSISAGDMFFQSTGSNGFSVLTDGGGSIKLKASSTSTSTPDLAINTNGDLLARNLKTTGIAPTTSGSTQTLIVDANGQFSFRGNAIDTVYRRIGTDSVFFKKSGTEFYAYKDSIGTGGGGSGTVTSVSVVSANGLAGSVATATTTPAITLSTTVTGILKGNGTVISAATSGTDYAPATSGTSILKGNGSGGFSNATSGTDYAPATSGSAILKGNGSGGFSNATAGTDYVAPNGAITGATKTKITYDAKGLVTAGADATTADIAASTNKNYVTDADLVTLSNTSGTNTGDQNLFNSVVVPGQTTVTPNSPTTALTLVAGTNVTLTTNNTTKAVTINATGGGGGSYAFSTGLTEVSGTVTSNLSTGVSGGQSVIGGTGSGENLLIQSTSNATKGLIQLEGTSSAFSAFKNSGNANLIVYKADNSGYAPIDVNSVLLSGTNAMVTNGTDIEVGNNAGWTGVNIFGGSTLGLAVQSNGVIGVAGTTSSFPGLKRNSTDLEVKLADNSAYAPISAAQIKLLGQSSDPTSVAGSIWYNTTSNVYKGKFNTTVRQFATLDGAETFTNKTLTTPIISSISNTGTLTLPTVTTTIVGYKESNTTSSGTPAPTGDAKENYYDLTALATAPTFSAPSGTPANHNSLLIRIKDDGTARALTWNAIYRGGTLIALPTTTTISKTMYVQFIYNGADSKWDLVGLTDGL